VVHYGIFPPTLLLNPKRAADVNQKKFSRNDYMTEIINRSTGMLYVVATPIGNLEDITLRAIRTLKEVNLVAAEDTRRTKKLLNAYEISTPLISLHEHNEKEKSLSIIARIKFGMNVAYVTDAGTPCLSDPGHYLVKMAQTESIRVIPIPGSSAVTASLSVCGFSADSFIFYGFLPAKRNKRRQFLEEIRNEEKTMVLYESPVRYSAALQDMNDILGDREIVVARELTKVFEDIKCGKISELMEKTTERRTKGEFTLILKGQEGRSVVPADDEIEKKLSFLQQNNKMSLKDAVQEVSRQTGLSRKKVYTVALKLWH
jgi:16S rRNA (cytidine1402-2'-O)-methyltransferase